MKLEAHEILTLLLAVAGAVTAIGGAVTYLKKWYNESKPSKNGEVIKAHDSKIKELDNRIAKLENTKQWHDSYIEAMCSAMLALLDHNINGDSIEKLKEAKEEMKEFLIHRG